MPTHSLAEDLLPDMIVRESDLYNNEISTSVEPGRIHLRLANGTANIGLGPLHIYGAVAGGGDDVQEVYQRIFADDGSYYDRLAGKFVYHVSHGHVHFDGWALYQLREILPGDGVGAVLASGKKTSFCLIDGGVYDSSLPNFISSSTYSSCGATTQGISVGWYDIYGKYLTGQNIDITDMVDGTYWLESIVDPDDTVLESDETNNVARIKVTIGLPEAIVPDPYEPNDSLSATGARTVGAVNSPHLGPTAPMLTMTGLNIETSIDDDWFRFYVAGTGGPSHKITVNFVHSLGDIDLKLFDDNGTELDKSDSVSNQEAVSLNGEGNGWYYVQVYGYSGATNPDYTITFEPPSNAPPVITTDSPPAGTVTLMHGIDNYSVEWTSNDPDDDPTWVNVYLNESATLDGNEYLIASGVNVDGAIGVTLIISAELEEGEYWVYCEISDGGSVVGAWSDGTVEFVEPYVSAVGDKPQTPARIMSAAPNPFNPSTSFRLELSQPTAVNIDIYDVRGRLVRHLFNGQLGAGLNAVAWDGRDDRGQTLASGVYHSVVVAGDVVQKAKVLLLK